MTRWITLALAAAAVALAAAPEATSHTQDDEAEIARLRAALERAEQACGEQLADLQAQLDAVNERRSEREFAWYQYNRALALLDLDERVPPFEVDPEFEPATVDPGDGWEDPKDTLASSLAERAREIKISLRHFLLVEEIRGIDLLEVGSLDRGAVGPVVFRLLDDRGRLAGGLTAERLRLEASRAGHTVTLVLENGFESRGGERVPFASGVRRIVLPYVDPEPWIGSFPELFPPAKLAPPVDDTLWNRSDVQAELNRLLRESGTGGFYRLRRMDGILAGALNGVQIEAFGAGGGLERRLFADRLTIAAEGTSIRLTLTDGVVIRGGERRPFVDGSYRIYLPGADVDAWRAAGLPGLSDPPGAARD